MCIDDFMFFVLINIIQKILYISKTNLILDLKKRTDGEVEAVVVCARKDTGSREVLRHSEFDGCVKLFKIKDHYIFSIESTGALDPLDLMKEAVKVLKDKCTIYKKELAVITS